MVKWVWDRVALKPSPAPCWFGWLILAVWPLMVLIGITTQWAVTGRGIHHQEREWAQSGLLASCYLSMLKPSPCRTTLPIPEAERFKASVCGFEPHRWHGCLSCKCCMLSGRGLCNELISRPEESYRLWCVILWEPETWRMRRPWPALGFCARQIERERERERLALIVHAWKKLKTSVELMTAEVKFYLNISPVVFYTGTECQTNRRRGRQEWFLW